MATTSARPSDPARTQISPTRLACRESVAFNTGSPVFSSLCIYLSFLSTSEIGPIRLSVFCERRSDRCAEPQAAADQLLQLTVAAPRSGVLGSGRTDHYRSWTASAGISALHLFFIFRVELRYEIWLSTVVSTRRKFRLRCVGLRLGFFQLLSHEHGAYCRRATRRRLNLCLSWTNSAALSKREARRE